MNWRSSVPGRCSRDFRINLIIDDLPTPQAPDTPMEIGLPFAWTMISATVSETPVKFRKSRSVSLSGHIDLPFPVLGEKLLLAGMCRSGQLAGKTGTPVMPPVAVRSRQRKRGREEQGGDAPVQKRLRTSARSRQAGRYARDAPGQSCSEVEFPTGACDQARPSASHRSSVFPAAPGTLRLRLGMGFVPYESC